MSAVLSAIDALGVAKIVIFNAGYSSALVTVNLAHPSFVMSSGVLTLQGTPLSATVTNTGTAALAQIQDYSGTWWVQNLSVGTSATDLIINSVALVAGQTLTISSGSITAAA